MAEVSALHEEIRQLRARISDLERGTSSARTVKRERIAQISAEVVDSNPYR